MLDVALPPVCLAISALDSSGAALLAADLKTLTALGTYGTGVATAVLVHDLGGLRESRELDEGLLRAQLEAVGDALPVAVVKVGYVPSPAAARIIARWLRARPQLPVVLDPVLVHHHGIPLMPPEMLTALQHELLPRATVCTPNRFEAAQLAGLPEVIVREDMERSAQAIHQRYGCSVVVTGGGLAGENLDVFCGVDGISHFAAPSIERPGDLHGAGCSFAAAIAAELARGEPLREAVFAAKSYVNALIRSSPLAQVSGRARRILCHCTSVDSLRSTTVTGITVTGGRNIV